MPETPVMKYRLVFSKIGRAKYLSHLDTMRVLQRALTRVEAPMAYSEGFNPHMQLSLPLPLPLGVESVCELADLRFTAPPASSLRQALNGVLPDGFQVLDVLTQDFPAQSVKWIRYTLTLERALPFETDEIAQLGGMSERDSLVILRKTKRGESDFDIMPHVKDITFTCADPHVVTGEVWMSAQEPTVNPAHMGKALEVVLGGRTPDSLLARRMQLYDDKGTAVTGP